MNKQKVISNVGVYKELLGASITNDGDYLRGELVVRTVSNGFDNTRRHFYPDDYGYFIGDTTPVSTGYVEKRISIVLEMQNFLVREGLLFPEFKEFMKVTNRR